jgi:hypothetical protein
MADTASARLVFQSPYKGGLKTWSTRLHVTGGDWQNQTAFETYVDNVWADWISTTATWTTLVEAVGYNAGSEVPVHTYPIGEAGTYNTAGLSHAPLESVILIRFSTDARSVKNHPIYLFNYIHGVVMNAADEPETPRADLKSAWQTRGNALIAGYSDGTLTRHRAGPRGAVAQQAYVETYLTHRDFPA